MDNMENPEPETVTKWIVFRPKPFHFYGFSFQEILARRLAASYRHEGAIVEASTLESISKWETWKLLSQ